MRITVDGVENVKKLFASINRELSQKEMVPILRAAGREVVKSARTFVPFTGKLKQFTKRDIGIVKARVVKGKAEVTVGLKFKLYDFNGSIQKVAPIVRHFTQGFKQTNRSSDGKNRGKVSQRTVDFILQGYEMSRPAQMAAINKAIANKLKKLK